MKNGILIATLLSSNIILNVNCENNKVHHEKSNQVMDTLTRPTYVSAKATLVRFGSVQEPRFVWNEIVGPYKKNDKVYPHILCVKYYYAEDRNDTIYYENMGIRNSNKDFDFYDYKMPFNQIDESTIDLINNKDSLVFFSVLDADINLNEEYNGIKYTRMSSIRKVATSYLATSLIEYNLEKKSKKEYTLTLRDGVKLTYQLNGICNEECNQISFINTEDGNIYFIQKFCFLELVNKEDINKLKKGYEL